MSTLRSCWRGEAERSEPQRRGGAPSSTSGNGGVAPLVTYNMYLRVCAVSKGRNALVSEGVLQLSLLAGYPRTLGTHTDSGRPRDTRGADPRQQLVPTRVMPECEPNA